MSVYTLALAEATAASSVYSPEQRLEIAAELMAAIGAGDTDALVVLPAGYAVAATPRRRDQWADGLVAASRNAGVALVFGIDVVSDEKWGMERCPRSYGYACDRGRRLLSRITPTARASVLVERTVTLGATRATVLFARELLSGRPRHIVEDARPDVVLVLGHGGPTKKWQAPFAAMNAIAPTVVAHQQLRVHRPATLPVPRGWCALPSPGPIQVVTYRREADGAATGVVGH